MSALKFSQRMLAAVAASALLAGCASTPAPVSNYSFGGSSPPSTSASKAAPPTQGQGAQTFGLGSHANGSVSAAGYTVAPGDTLYSIAFANGMDVRDLASLNGISPPYVIHPGQVLKLKPAQAGASESGRVVAGSATAAATPSSRRAASVPAAQPSAPVFGPVTSQSVTGSGVAPAGASSIATSPMASVPATAATAMPPTSVQAQEAQPAMPIPPPGATRNVAGIAWQWPANGKLVGGFQAGSGGDGAGLDIAGNIGDPVRAAASGTVVYSGNGLIGYGELIIIKHNEAYLSAYGHNSKRLVKEGQHVSAGQEIALMGASGAPRVELHFEIRKDGKPVDPLGYLPQR